MTLRIYTALGISQTPKREASLQAASSRMSPAPEMEAAERQICPLMPHPHGSSQKTAGYQGSQIKERSKMQMERR